MAWRKLQQSALKRPLTRLLLLVIILLTAIGQFTSHFGWPIYLELLSHFQLQYWVLSTIALGAIALMGSHRSFLLGLVCTTALAAQILPWYLPPNFAEPMAGSDRFRVLIANVNNRNQAYNSVLSFAQATHPDLAVFMEVNAPWLSTLKGLLEELPYAAGENIVRNRGIVLYSRYPLTDIRFRQFSQDSETSILGTIGVHGKTIAFVATHPLPPIPTDYFHARNQQLQQVGEYLQTVEPPKMLLGDLNITPWSPYYKRLVRQADLKNTRDGFGLLPSWPTRGSFSWLPSGFPLLFSIPIDHVLVSPELPVANIQLGPNVGSDHRPVIVDLKV